jgi:hypothetical protein
MLMWTVVVHQNREDRTMNDPTNSGEPTVRPCKCGSGKPYFWLRDFHGIELADVCVECEAEARGRFNPWVFTGYNQAFLDEYSGECIEPIDC